MDADLNTVDAVLLLQLYSSSSIFKHKSKSKTMSYADNNNFITHSAEPSIYELGQSIINSQSVIEILHVLSSELAKIPPESHILLSVSMIVPLGRYSR